jgi:hypothetical protein
MKDIKFCRACGHKEVLHGDRAVWICASQDLRSGPPDYKWVPCYCKGYVE